MIVLDLGREEPRDRAEVAIEERWIVENGPFCPDLVALVSARTDIDFFLCYSYRYFTGIKAALAAGRRAILVRKAG